MSVLPLIGFACGLLLMLGMIYLAFSGPSKAKAGNRRLEAVKERHSQSSAVAAQAQMKRVLAQRRAARDDSAVHEALARMVEASRSDANMVPAMLDAARAEATLGEICDALRAEWGDYREPPRF